jgi:hypothetical protein
MSRAVSARNVVGPDVCTPSASTTASASDGLQDGGAVVEPGGGDGQPLLRRHGQPGGVPDDRGDPVPGVEGLGDDVASGAPGGPEHGDVHCVSSWGE